MLLASCDKRCEKKDGQLFINKTRYEGAFKTSGYYYLNSLSNGNHVFVFFRNGIAMSTFPSDFQVFESGISTEPYKDRKYGWGAFLIEDTNIRIETWEPRKCGYPVYAYIGKKINDSTFVIYEYFGVKNKEDYTQLNDTFRFKQTFLKPDSTQPYL